MLYEIFDRNEKKSYLKKLFSVGLCPDGFSENFNKSNSAKKKRGLFAV